MTAVGPPGRGFVVPEGVIPGAAELVSVEPLGGGHIHQTFLATCRHPTGRWERLVVQRVNTEVFTDPVLLAANVARVAAHLDGREAPRAAGAGTVTGADGSWWRAWAYLPGRTRRRFATPAQAAGAAAAVARLAGRLADLPGPPLVEPITGFHDFGRRVRDFEVAVAADCHRRGAGCRAEVEGVRSAAVVVADFDRARAAGLLPERVVHNDAKAENVLFEEDGEGVRAVLDLDTVAPGTVLFDVGDLIRSGAATGPEDSTDVDRLGADPAIVAAVTAGYVGGAGGWLTDGERSLLYLAGPLMAFEAALRFLTDHLAGDVYFQIARPGHNLDRCRAQLRLCERLGQLR